MVIVKSPFRISFFGGSTDYKDFYEQNGSYIIGTTIDKNVYLSMRFRPSILSKESVITYSQMQMIKQWDDINNPLIREVLKYKKINKPIEFNSFSDVPSRTGLGGSSAFCIGMLYLINNVMDEPPITKQKLISDAIYIERTLLKEAGGIQDQIWPAYGGLNTIEIKPDGIFHVKPLAVTEEFKEELQNSILLIYTNNQREQDSIATSHENKDKKNILNIAKEAHGYFINENIEMIGKLLYYSWTEKSKISSLISTSKIDNIINIALSYGAYGAKLLGSGGCGFIMVICNPLVKLKLTEIFKGSTLDCKFSNDGVSVIYKG
jgi:D-glycero-alpha-D-manno-heptose-7-phosphate kinase